MKPTNKRHARKERRAYGGDTQTVPKGSYWTRRQFLRGLALAGGAATLMRCAGVIPSGAGNGHGPGTGPRNGTVNNGEIDPSRFDFRLLDALLKQERGKNALLSAFSVATALAMTYNGAEGATREAMAKALELDGMDLQSVNLIYADLVRRLQSIDPEVEVAIANSLWARRGVVFKPGFLERNRTYFGAQATSLDFSDPHAREIINAWVEKSTKGKIAQIVDGIDPMDALFLINAIYFKGTWTDPFGKAETREEPFFLSGGGQKKVSMMSRSGSFAHLQGDHFQAIRLPYGTGRISMEVFLPDRGSSLNEFVQRLNPENWHSWMSRFTEKPCLIKLPRFRMEYEVSLKEALETLGMGIAFDPSQADFSGMAEERLAIDEVKHKSFIAVNEAGTEAAAVTSVGVCLAALIEREPMPFGVDRPFFYAIRDHQTGLSLFLGLLYEPA